MFNNIINSLTLIVSCITIVYASYNFRKNKNKKYVPSGKWTCNGVQIIPLNAEIEKSLDTLTVAPKFVKWLQTILETGELLVPTVTVTDVNWFSAKPDPVKLGFVKCILTDAVDAKTGKKVMSNIVFIRGNSVAVLIIVKVLGKSVLQDKKYVLLCEQMRASMGKKVKEICAGMTDAEGNIMSVALKEVQEETGIQIKHIEELWPLGTIMPSPGACDELIYLYAYQTVMSSKEFEEKQQKLYGNAEEHEEIQLQFVEINEYENMVLEETGDAKGECAFRRWKQQ
jgi:ADP-sugar diphosphatase